MLRAALVLMVLLAGPALAATGGDQVNTSHGEAYSRAWCSACHAVGRGEAAAESSAVPSFQSLADNPELTEIALHAFLNTPHRTMLNVILSPDQADDIVTYILSLRHK
ncbi:MAG TPA: c-type cytochrome [Stellaceae bacterium]|nr:c-type cytochrome [Stellaceae bacterium]